MKLNKKTLLFFVAIMGLLVIVLTALSTYSFRQFSLYMAERHARSVAETIKVGLTESMINGTIDKRQQFLARLTSVPGVQAVRVVRGPAVTEQFGVGLAQESAVMAGERQVLADGKPVFSVVETEGAPVFQAVIPYVASDQGLPNCLQCHQVKTGAVLGTVAIEISLGEVKDQALVAVLMVSLAVIVAAALASLLLRRLLRPLTETAGAVQRVTTFAVGGDFSHRVRKASSDEIGEIAADVNRLMEFLEKEIGTIGSRVGLLMGQHATEAGNQLVSTTEMVEGLVEAAQFKQAIEEDMHKADIYRRIGDVLQHKYDIKRFSIYEVASSKNRIVPVIVDGAEDGDCRWCDPQILIDSSYCRCLRTGRTVSGVDFPTICTMFRPSEDGGDTHICLPITQSGTVGCVVQMVLSPDEGALVRLLVPYIAVYLREAAPVLEAKRLMEHLRENSMRDGMTGLYNRRFLEEYVNTLVSATQRRKQPFSVLMLDLDFFKQVNDTHGHEAGDKVIKTLADILMRNMRSSDMVVRYGGEEFLVVLMDTAAEAAVGVAEKIRLQVAETKVPLPGGVLQKTISIGVAEFPNDSDTFWQVVKFADVALYKAKHQGRNQVVRFLPEMWDKNEHY